MDITVIKEALSDFATFANNVAGLFQKLPYFIVDLAGFLTGGAEEGANTTSSVLGSSEAAAE